MLDGSPLPFAEVNAEDARRVAQLLGLAEVKRQPRKFPCLSCGSSDAAHAYPAGGLFCFACNRRSSNLDAAMRVWGLDPRRDAVEGCVQLAGLLGFGHLVPEWAEPDRTGCAAHADARAAGQTAPPRA